MSDANSRKLKLMLNEVEVDNQDPTKVKFSMVILDGDISGNNVKVTDTALESLAKSIKGMPIVTKYLDDLEDFGDHEAFLDENKNGEEFLNRDTIAIGSFIEEGFIDKMEVDGSEISVLKANGVLWKTRYSDIVDTIVEMFESGIKINTSSEYVYRKSNVSFDEDGTEIHDGNIYFEGIAVLGSRDNFVAPAYENATFTTLNSVHLPKYNQLVAQALNAKGGEKVERQFNELSMYQRSRELEVILKAELGDDVKWLWVDDLYADRVIFKVEDDDYNVTTYQVEYTVNEDTVSVNKESMQEVKEVKEWKVVSNQMDEKLQGLETQINELTQAKGEIETKLNEMQAEKEGLATKLNEATETIATLNAQVEELTALNAELAPFKEQVELAQKEAKINEVKGEFEAKFNSVDGAEVFATEEIQNLLNQVIEEGEVGLNAKLQLNEKVLELASVKLEKALENPTTTIMNSKVNRDFSALVKDKESDILSELM